MAEKPKGIYVPVDVLITDDEDIAEVGMFGFALYVSGLCYSKRRRTDGLIPRSVLTRLLISPSLEDIDALPDTVARLCKSGLWKATRYGYAIRNWNAWNPTEEDREGWAARMRRSRRSHEDVTPMSPGVLGDVTPASRDVTPMSRVEVEEKGREEKRTKNISALSRFDAFWKSYPPEGKRDKPKVRTNFAAACRRVPAEVIIAAAAAYAADPNRDPNHTKNAQGWLTGDRWNDPPVSVRDNGKVGVLDRMAAQALREVNDGRGASSGVGDSAVRGLPGP